MCFFLKICEFSELCQFCCSAGFLPAWCVYTQWLRGKTEKGKSQEYFKIFEKKTQYLLNTLYMYICVIIPQSCVTIIYFFLLPSLFPQYLMFLVKKKIFFVRDKIPWKKNFDWGRLLHCNEFMEFISKNWWISGRKCRKVDDLFWGWLIKNLKHV